MTIAEAKNKINSNEQLVNNEYAALVATAKNVGSTAVNECLKKERTRLIILVVLWVVSFILSPLMLVAIGYSIYYYVKFKKGYKQKESAVAQLAADNLLREINGYQQYFK